MAAFLLSPWVVPAVFLIRAFFTPWNPQEFKPVPFTLAIIAPISLAIAYISEIFFGILGWLILEHFRIRSLAAYAALGALIGILAFVVIAIPLDGSSGRFFNLSNPLLYTCAAAGSLSASLFRTILFFRLRRTHRRTRERRSF